MYIYIYYFVDEQVLFCAVSELQAQLYKKFLGSKQIRNIVAGAVSDPLSCITSLKKLCNHPSLVYDMVRILPKNELHYFTILFTFDFR